MAPFRLTEGLCWMNETIHFDIPVEMTYKPLLMLSVRYCSRNRCFQFSPPPALTRICSHQSEQFGLWKWALLLLLTFSIFLSQAPRIPQVPLTKRRLFPALQKHSHVFPMFPAFALPLPLINENTRGCSLLSIWVEIQGWRGNQNHPVRLRCPWTSKLNPQKSAGIRNYFVFMPLKGND